MRTSYQITKLLASRVGLVPCNHSLLFKSRYTRHLEHRGCAFRGRCECARLILCESQIIHITLLLSHRLRHSWGELQLRKNNHLLALPRGIGRSTLQVRICNQLWPHNYFASGFPAESYFRRLLFPLDKSTTQLQRSHNGSWLLPSGDSLTDKPLIPNTRSP